MSAPQSNPVITDVFVEGARKGWGIATSSTLPNVVMAFIIIKALEITGALKGLGMIFAPLMGLFGLPGEAAAVLIGGWMSMGGGIGVAIGLFDKGILTGGTPGHSRPGYLSDGLAGAVPRPHPRRDRHARQTHSPDDRHFGGQRLLSHAADAHHSLNRT